MINANLALSGASLCLTVFLTGFKEPFGSFFKINKRSSDTAGFLFHKEVRPTESE